METIWGALSAELPDLEMMVRVSIRLIAAMLLGGIVGLQRERTGKPAGLRTHMLVAMGMALFVVAPLELGMSLGDLSRVIQGLATGIGFLGGGVILKLSEERQIQGLTTAASIWMTAAIGTAVGLGHPVSALFGVILTWIVLAVLGSFEHWVVHGKARRPTTPSDDR